jgi:putative phage-type endonuclease
MFTETTTVGNLEERKARLQPLIDAALKNDRMIYKEGMPLEDWLVLRALIGLGGTDVAPALNISEYKTPYELWKEKLVEEVTTSDNDIMWFGREAEDLTAKGYSRMVGRKVMEDPYIRIHAKHDCLFANLDRIIADNGDGMGAGVLECKSTEHSVYKTWLESIPINYYCQIQHSLSVTGFKWAAMAVLVGRTIKIIPIARDDEYIEKQNVALVAWYNGYVKAVVPPERKAPDFAFIDPIVGTVKEVDSEVANIIDELKEAQIIEKDIKVKVADLKDKVKEFIGDDEGLTHNGELIATYKMVHKKEYMVKAHSERQLRFKKQKGE